MLFHDGAYQAPEILAVSESQKSLRELAEKDARGCFGDEYLKGREWTDAQSGNTEAQSFDNDDDDADYFIVEVTNGTI